MGGVTLRVKDPKTAPQWEIAAVAEEHKLERHAAIPSWSGFDVDENGYLNFSRDIG